MEKNYFFPGESYPPGGAWRDEIVPPSTLVLKRTYTALTIEQLELDMQSPVLAGSILGVDVEISSGDVKTDNFTDDGDFGSGGFDVDFD